MENNALKGIQFPRQLLWSREHCLPISLLPKWFLFVDEEEKNLSIEKKPYFSIKNPSFTWEQTGWG